MITTLTPHPSLDRTVVLAGPLERGTVLRVTSSGAQAAGKGVNISRAAVSAGLPTVAVFPAEAEDSFVRELAAAGVTCVPVAGGGPIRVNLTLTEPDGTTTKLNASAVPAGPALLDALADAVLQHADDGWVVLAGSLPPGAPDDWYARVARALRRTPARVAVDTSDAPLAALVADLESSAPHLLKPNTDELASITGADPTRLEGDPAAAARAARTLVDRGVDAVLATLGGAGAVLVTRDVALHATPPPTTVVSTVGAGDCSLFGYLLGEQQGLRADQRLALAVAYGSAAAALPGTTIPTPAQVRPGLVHVTKLDIAEGSPS
ncbi:1-phosphofructokinase family hexose kinase [Nocardioides jiangxiensis]|uniref:1-phosphofructokinase family hexose kinase n=1 Tax=Nocardioides jiangxiensis TaxID=3064524 RepID=A0ABT9B3G5_9ACTN|nr:1-phosphofructokinase family hexose kinase [Nocardioides sp. WY-20]MDO7869243.1 1-phosphofructokinase family hexose kinase [Nocardioides sp. WY-20]